MMILARKNLKKDNSEKKNLKTTVLDKNNLKTDNPEQGTSEKGQIGIWKRIVLERKNIKMDTSGKEES